MKIVTHRFRGFSERENSFQGFRNALNAGVTAFELDVRLTLDGVPVINHDRHTQTSGGRKVDLVSNNFLDIESFFGGSDRLKTLMTLEEALDLFSSMKQEQSKIFVDIKDFGEEEKILSLIKDRGLNENVVVVSWLPEVLFGIHRIDPHLPLCFSHNYISSRLQFDLMKEFLTSNAIKHVISGLASVANPPSAAEIKNTTFFFEEYNERENVPGRVVSTKRDFEHTLNGPVRGRLLDIITESKGYLCIQYKMLDEKYASYYTKAPGIIPYSINDFDSLERLPMNLDYPFILSDNPEMVSRF